MPKLVHLYIFNCLAGFLLAAILVGLLLVTNTANLGHLARNSDAGTLAVIMLWVANGIVFAGVQFGIAMRMSGPEAPGGGRRAAGPAHRPANLHSEH